MATVLPYIDQTGGIWHNTGVKTQCYVVRTGPLRVGFGTILPAHSVPALTLDSPKPTPSGIGVTTSVRVWGHVALLFCSPTKEKQEPRKTHGSEGRRVAVDDAERMSSQLTLVKAPGNVSVVDPTKRLRPGPNVTSSKTVRIRQFIAGERRTPSAACKVNSLSHAYYISDEGRRVY